MFPLYNDKNTVELMIKKSSNVLKKLKRKYEIIIVDDGCPQNSGKLAAKIGKRFSNVKVFFHKKNLGYGAALKTGLKKCKNDWIFMIDGDAEYDVDDLFRLLKVSKRCDLVICWISCEWRRFHFGKKLVEIIDPIGYRFFYCPEKVC